MALLCSSRLETRAKPGGIPLPDFTKVRLCIGLRDAEFPRESGFAILFQNCPERQSPYDRPSALTPEAPSFTPNPPLLRTEYAQFGVPTEAAEMAEHYVLAPRTRRSCGPSAF
jgi:hypothetical protein